jgi:hypothetical protein
VAFSFSTIWVCPAGVFSLLVQVYGAGGGGGGYNGNCAGVGAGGSGGAGGYSNQIINVVPGNSYAITIGTGGTPGNSCSNCGGSPGTNGSSSSFNGIVNAAGGDAGQGQPFNPCGINGTSGNNAAVIDNVVQIPGENSNYSPQSYLLSAACPSANSQINAAPITITHKLGVYGLDGGCGGSATPGNAHFAGTGMKGLIVLYF